MSYFIAVFYYYCIYKYFYKVIDGRCWTYSDVTLSSRLSLELKILISLYVDKRARRTTGPFIMVVAGKTHEPKTSIQYLCSHINGFYLILKKSFDVVLSY